MVSQIALDGKSPLPDVLTAMLHQEDASIVDVQLAEALRLVHMMAQNIPSLQAGLDVLPTTHRVYLTALLEAHGDVLALTTPSAQPIRLDALRAAIDEYTIAFDVAYVQCYALYQWRLEYALNLAEQLTAVDARRAANMRSRIIHIQAELPDLTAASIHRIVHMLQRLDSATIPAETTLHDQEGAQ